MYAFQAKPATNKMILVVSILKNLRNGSSRIVIQLKTSATGSTRIVIQFKIPAVCRGCRFLCRMVSQFVPLACRLSLSQMIDAFRYIPEYPRIPSKCIGNRFPWSLSMCHSIGYHIIGIIARGKWRLRKWFLLC